MELGESGAARSAEANMKKVGAAAAEAYSRKLDPPSRETIARLQAAAKVRNLMLHLEASQQEETDASRAADSHAQHERFEVDPGAGDWLSSGVRRTPPVSDNVDVVPFGILELTVGNGSPRPRRSCTLRSRRASSPLCKCASSCCTTSARS